MYTASLKRSENYKAQPYQYASPSKQILKAKAKPFPPCTHCGFNVHRLNDCRNYPECEICRSYDHFTSGHNRVIHIRGGVLAESFQSSESSIGVKCNTYPTTDHNDFDNFKRETHQGAHLVKCNYVTRNTGKGRKNVENVDSYEGLRRNTYDSVTPMSHPSQRYGVTWLISYAITYFMPTTWKASSSLYGITLCKVTPYPFDYRVTLGFGSIAGGLDPVSPVIRLPIEHGINSGTRIGGFRIAGIIGQTKYTYSEMSNAGQPETTIDEYLTKVRDDSGPGIVKPSFKENIKFKFWGQYIIDLFHSPRVSRDQVMLMAFPFTLKGRARQWMKQLSIGLITTCDLFKNALLSKYHPHSQIIKKINAIRNFEQESNEPLHLAWERQKVDFKGPIPRMTPAARIKAITELSRHSLSWYKEGDFKDNDLNIVFRQINNFEQNMNNITEEVQMVQHKYKLPDKERISKLEETLRTFIEESRRKQKQNESLFWKIKKNCDKVFKKQAYSIKTIEGHLG
ncbi:retrovirus-related pol polyprotein from transposon TNT 1-94 [Tanacetum coccineum]